MHTRPVATILASCFLTAIASCSSSSSNPSEEHTADAATTCATDAGDYSPTIDPADFSTKIDNPLYPLVPGTAYTFMDSDGNIGQTIVTTDTKTIFGVACVAVHDYATTPEGVILEDTWDYFTQDRAGDVWYFGEDTKAYSGATISTVGSWLAGVDCARPGIVMKASPQVGDSYRQEYLVGSAEDEADVLALDETVTVKYGTFEHCLKTRDYTRLDPGNDENKYYCAGVGLVLTVDLVTVGIQPREELVFLNGAAGDAGDAGTEGGDGTVIGDSGASE